METLGWYLLKSAVWLTGFALVFLVALRNERYFRLNRIYLLSGIVASIVFPLFTWHYAVVLPSVPLAEISISEMPAQVMFPVQETVALPVYWWFYLAGVICLVLRLIWQTGKVVRKLKKTGYEANGSVKLVRTSEYAASFSFFSFVFVNPSTSELETNEIVNHEREHIEQHHWFDLLLAELLCLLQWFNPFVWIYSRLIRQNHEYLADEMALLHTDNPAVYQATLLNQMFGGPVISLANSFSYSLNKKRFKMMKKSIDSPFRKLRLLVVLPLIAMVFYAFAKPEYISTPSEVQAQDSRAMHEGKVVKGKVVNSEGKPLAGTTVVLKGTNTGTITDKDGNFELKSIPQEGELVFSFVGMKSAVVKPDFDQPMDISLQTENVGIDKITVTGLANDKTPPPPPPPGVKGRSKARLSDFRSIDANNPPLIFLDGKSITKAQMDAIDQEKIESVNVLKIGDATAQYGEQGKNGVIVMTSKKNGTTATPMKANELDKVVVVGYGAKNEPAPSTVGKGNLNGVNIREIDPENPPLIYLDGVVIDRKQMAAVSPDKIESISVLKDKSATAVYGEKGKNGVVLIVSKGKTAAASEPKMQQTTYTPGKGTKTADVFVTVEQMPQFPGGQQALMNFFRSNMRYPVSAIEQGATGNVIVSFIVSSSGKVVNGSVIRSVHPALDKEALRIIGLMPDWQPGRQNGEAVDVSYVISVEFMLQTPKKESKGIATGPIPTQISPEEDVAFVIVEQMPQFPGGENAMRQFIQDNLKYPAAAKEQGVQGTVIVSFVVNKEGKIIRTKIIRGIGAGCDEEAVRIIGIMPDWKPGMQGGKPVNVSYTVPVKFTVK